VDATEVTLQALAGVVIERDERRRRRGPLAADVVADAFVAAGVAVFVAQPADDLGDGVALLARRGFIGAEDRVDDGFEGIDHRGDGPASIGLGLGLGEDLADLAARVMEASGQFADAHPVDAMGVANACVLVHRDHPPPPAAGTSAR